MHRSLLRSALSFALAGALLGCAARPNASVDRGASLAMELSRIPASTDAAIALRRSQLLRALGRQEEALTELGAAEDAAREKLDWRGLTALWREAGDTYIELGRAEDALLSYRKRLETAVSLEDKALRASALADAAYAFVLLGSTSRADEAASEAKLLAGDELTRDPKTAERLALTHERLDAPELADELFERATRGYEAAGDRAGAARTRVYRAELSLRTKGRAEGLDALDAVVAESLDPDPAARLERAKAEAAYLAHDDKACAAHAREASRLADGRGLYVVAKAGRVLLARCAGSLGETAEAIDAAEQAADLVEDQRGHLSGDRARQEAGFEALQIYRMLIGLETRLPEGERAARVFDTAERARARAHLDALARSQAGQSWGGSTDPTSPMLLRDKARAEETVRRLTRELTAGRAKPGMADRHRDALWALEDIEEAIRQENPLLRRISVPRPATLSDVRASMLDDDTTLIAYFVAEEQVLAIAVTKKDERLVVLDTSPDELASDVAAYRRTTLLDPSQDLGAVKRAGQRLYQKLLAPLSPKAKVVIIPHGPLTSLPFEALVDAEGKFVVETHEVRYSLSATLGVELAKMAKPKDARRAFVGMGDPVYDFASFTSGKPEGSTAAASRGLSLWIEASSVAVSDAAEKASPALGLARLPGTGTELRAIAKLFGADQKLYLRSAASEDNVKRGALGGARIVHVASHGLLEPHYQALALSQDPASKEDGFLLNSEIAALTLDADLVVLSACQTGRTRVRSGEPVAGLSLALRAAGARRVVVSLWSVDDDATARLMLDFYKPLVKESRGYAESLTAAKRAMIKAGPAHPYFWAPFILLG